MSRNVVVRARWMTWQGIKIMLWMKRRNSMQTYCCRSRCLCIIMANQDLRFQARAAMTI